MNKPITFVIFAYNEEKRIAQVIRNFIDYGEVFILDGGSTDKTKEIAERMGAKFFVRPENKKAFMETEENFAFVKSIITTDWLYWGYADNIAPKSLVEKMIELASENKYKSVNIPLYTYLWGYTDGYVQKAYAPFLYHKDFIDFKNNFIHGLGRFTGTKDQQLFLPSEERFAIKHFSVYTLSKFVTGHLRYAETEAQQKFERGEKFSLLKTVAAMFRYMLIYGKCSYKNGTLGILIILLYPFFRLMVYIKLYELENNITLETVEKNYNIAKTKILTEGL